MSFSRLLVIGTCALLSACATFQTGPVQPRPNPGPYTAVSLDGFADGIHHWRNRYGNNYAKYEPSQIVEIANNVLLYQRDNGGWVENRDPTRILSADEIAQIAKEKSNPTVSLDNRNVYSQIEYLSAVYLQTGDVRYRDAVVRGFDLTLSLQHKKCGGWPHTVPGSEYYHPYITMADEVTSGMLRTLRKIGDGVPPYGWMNETMRQRARESLKKGDACVLQLQVRQNGKLTGWAGQYHPETLEPVMGRTFELASIVSQESMEMTRYLMGIPNPTPEQVAAIEGAISWFERSAIKGWRIETFKIDTPIKYTWHTASADRRLVEDPAAPRLWARFYDLNDNSVVLANRDSVRVKDYSQIHHERRTGYDWYGVWPEKLLTEDYPAWKARVRQ
jgi:PelA/Pel-15E family pectate lyase